jgi:hypothetical protein
LLVGRRASLTYEACRICFSGVHSANSTSATKRGSTHRSVPGRRFDQRPGLFHLVRERRAGLLQVRQFGFERAGLFPAPAGADTADRNQLTGVIMDAQNQTSDLSRPSTAIGVTNDHELLSLFASELGPSFGAAGLVRCIGALRGPPPGSCGTQIEVLKRDRHRRLR